MTVASTRAPEWLLDVDWERTGDWTSVHGDLSARIQDIPGIDIRWGRDQARPLGRWMVPSASLDVHNHDRVLSPGGGSAIASLLTSFPPARIRARYGTNATMDDPDVRMDDFTTLVNGVADVGVLNGFLDKPDQHPELGQRTVGLAMLGDIGKLINGQPLYTPLRQNYRIDEAINEILDRVSWSSGARVISTSDTTMAWWWLDGDDPFEALVDLWLTEGAGSALYGHNGIIYFENRNYRAVTARSITAQATFADFAGGAVLMDDPVVTMDSPTTFMDGATDAYWYVSSGFSPEHMTIINDVSAVAKIRAAQTLAKVWENGSTIVLAAGESETVIATGDDPWTGAVTPTLTTDYTVTGTASVAVSMVAYATRVEITFTASGSGTATIAGPSGASTGPQLRAQPVTVISQKIVTNTVNADVTASRDKHGRRRPDDSWTPRQELTESEFVAVMDALVEYHAQPRPVLRLNVRNADGRHLHQILNRRISDRIRIVHGHLGISVDAWIEQCALHAEREHVEIEFLCQLALDELVALWDTALWDGGDDLGWGN